MDVRRYTCMLLLFRPKCCCEVECTCVALEDLMPINMSMRCFWGLKLRTRCRWRDMGLLCLMQGILEHTLFKGTYFPTWEGLFWEKVWPPLCPLSCFQHA